MDELTPLRNDTLERLGPDIRVPRYDRATLTPGILHFGVGNFHKAHQARYLDKLMDIGKARDWAIIGAGVLDAEKPAWEVMKSQDCLVSLIEQSAGNSEACVVGSIIDYIEPGQSAAIVAALADPAIRIVSMTVTEGGYFLDANGDFDPDHPSIRADAAAPDAPATMFGLIAAGLKRRRAEGIGGFTVLTCDNIPHNGTVAKNAVVGFARLADPGLATWIEANVAFPNSMVDRITPATTDRERAAIRADYGLADGWPVYCEDFTQWVLEDDFPYGRPPLEEVGVQFVGDVSPYESMKLRILNGGHQTLSNASGLLGVEFVDDAMAHSLIRPFLDKVEREEIIPVVAPVPDTDPAEYYDVIARRFSNPKVADRTRRLAFDGSNKQSKFILGPLRDGLARGGPIEGLALQNALWCRYCFGTREDGSVIEPNDPRWDGLARAADAARADPGAWLAQASIYGDLAANARFAGAFGAWLSLIWAEGTAAALQAYCSEDA